MKLLPSFLLLACTTLAACTSVKQAVPTSNLMVYVGTYAKPDAESIFAFRLNEATGQLTPAFAVKGGENPSFLAFAEDRRHLYAVNETTEYEGRKSGAVSAFAVDQKTGSLTFLNRQPSLGGAPCYISLDPKNNLALVANYVGGNVAAFPLQQDGRLGAASDTDQHEGKGPRPQQDAPHAHCLLPDPARKFALAVDLGIDQIIAYRINKTDGQLVRQPQPAFAAKTGAGPRHLTFHPNQRFAYVINELNSTLTALSYDPSTGKFTEVQTVSTLPAGFTGENSCADVHVSPDGRFLYGSNRGHDSLAVFQIDQKTNQLTLVQHESVQGKWPRNFGFSPSGQVVLVANQHSNNITAFRVDRATGKLTYTGQSVAVPSPVFVQAVTAFPETPGR